jgi:poly(3-hydroxyalkanoate) synthetase
MEKKDEQIAALEEQLTIKNEETTQAHEQNFELKKKFNKDIDDLNDKISEMEKERQTTEIEYQNLIQGRKQLTNELNSIKEEKRQLNMQ